MSRKLIQETNLQNIAAAIRAKNGGSSTYKPREMADAIRALPSPGTLVPKAITQNGSYSPASQNADGFSSVTVNVGRNLVHKSITRNGSFSAASDHVDGFSSVSVNVPNSYSALDEGKVVSSGALSPQTSLSVTQNGTFDTTRNNQVTVNVSGASNTLVSKTITANGTYLPADDNADGFNWVNVAVPGGFSASDEGKVVQNGALMPQTSLNVTANGTYDTTNKNSVVVNVAASNDGSAKSLLTLMSDFCRLDSSNGYLAITSMFLSKNIGDTFTVGGRYFTRTTNDEILVVNQNVVNGGHFCGYAFYSTNPNCLGQRPEGTYGEYGNIFPFVQRTSPGGNTYYAARMQNPWENSTSDIIVTNNGTTIGKLKLCYMLNNSDYESTIALNVIGRVMDCLFF